MAQATVKTVQYLDPRIEPQPDPVYDYVIGPTQNQYYKIPASGLSNSSITFNNLTTLGIDRAYLDTFEIELGITITFSLDAAQAENDINPRPWEWTFDSFPFNKCCDEARININGGAFFSQPMSYIRAKERYMNQTELARCYENICPCHKPICQTESGRIYARWDGNHGAAANGTPVMSTVEAIRLNRQCVVTANDGGDTTQAWNGFAVPTRTGMGMFNYMQAETGMLGGFNNSIVKRGKPVNVTGTAYLLGYENYTKSAPNSDKTTIRVSWREPIFCSPFSSRYDATYGRPLYNITSMDLSFTLQNLGNMIRIINYNQGAALAGAPAVASYTIKIESANLCYQVMTIPPILNKPLPTLVPYRRFVPYITDYNQVNREDPQTVVPTEGATISITSGVYTLNEMPTAIWVFCAPSKRDLQDNLPDYAGTADGNVLHRGNWDTNKLFGYIKRINISMANTTQILADRKSTSELQSRI